VPDVFELMQLFVLYLRSIMVLIVSF